MKFNIDDYGDNFVVRCKTEEEANIFCAYMHSIGRRWNGGDSYKTQNYYHGYAQETCYDFMANCYGDIDFFIDEGYTILEFDEFDWSEFRKEPVFRVYKTDKAVIDDFLSGFQLVEV